MAEREEWITKQAGYSKISEILPGVTKPVFDQLSKVSGTIIANWPLIAGEEVYPKALPVKVTGGGANNSGNVGKKWTGVLHLQIKDAYALELQHMEPIILERINLFLGYKAIERLKFYQVQDEDNKKLSKHDKKFNCTPLASSIESELAGISDESLRSALKELLIDIK